MLEIVMQLIMTAGDAKSCCMEALQEAKQKNYEKAKELLEQANSQILHIHRLQTQMMQRECSGEKIEFSILLVHSQDHLTNAMITYDLAKEFIDFMEETDTRMSELEKMRGD